MLIKRSIFKQRWFGYTIFQRKFEDENYPNSPSAGKFPSSSAFRKPEKKVKKKKLIITTSA